MQLRRRAAAAGLAVAALSGAGVVASPSADAAVIGDGVTAPSHDESLAVITVCRPFTWLNRNFSDHGRDIANYKMNRNSFSDIGKYAAADAAFHLPATFMTLGGLTNIPKYCLS